nr:putative disease resistance protein RGA3 [Quercus suber]
MADALLLLATDLLKQLGSIAVQQAQQEINLIVGVDEEIEKLSSSFKIVQAMLNDAEERQWTEAAVKLWLDQLRDMYYMMDDVLDKWNTARIKSEIQKEEERAVTNNNPAALKKKVPCSFFPSLSCCFRQVDNLSLRHEIGHKIEILKQTLDKILKDKVTYGFDLTRHSHVEVERPTTTSFVDVSDIIGRDDYRDELLSNLLGVGSQEERNPRVISLVGMGGIGKTTLSQLAYNHLEVKAKFQKRMWVCVSDPFDQCTVAKAIIQEASPGHESLNNITEFETLLGQIHALIDGKKFLLVLDDVWTEDSTKWESFRNTLKCGAQGSRILVTTRNNKVAIIMESAHIINLRVLSNEDCWLLFSKIAFFDKNVEQRIELEDIGKQIANRCKGLPLAAKTLGSLMRFKSSREQWEGILHSNLWKIEYVKKGLFAPLLLSFYDLPLPMKLCFLYCGVFPKDYVFKKDQLVFLWMAQGYIETRESKEMEITGEEYFENLVIRSFFQDVKIDNGVIIRCKMHDIVHDFAQSVRINEYFEINDDKNLEIDYKSLRHLSLDISKEMQILELVYRAINLRTLFLHFHGRYNEFNMHLSDLCHHFRCLRTLILDCPFTKLPDAVENLIHLRCLHMYENVEIEELPETLCNLCNLQTLNIDNGKYFKKLP